MITNTFAVVALFEPVVVGTSVHRSAWPAHLTLVSNFATGARRDDVMEVVRDAVKDHPPVEALIAGGAMFGPAGNIPVQLVERGEFARAHEALADAVERLPDFVAEEPDYWHDGYRPHITLRCAENLREGDARSVRCIATVQLTKEFGTILDVLDLPLESA